MTELFHGMNQFQSWNASYNVWDLSPRTQKPAWPEFVRAFASIDGFRGESSFRTWLFTIERRLLLDRVRAEKRRRGGVEIQEGDAVTEFDALDGMVAGEMEGRLHRAIERLSPTQRQVFTLRVAEGISYRDIADAVGTTEGAARVHYHNAMRAVKEFLND